MLGIKQIKVVLKNDYTTDTLFEAIKDHEFTPGKPKIVKHGFTNIICFPELDRQNQVQIIPGMTQGAKPGPKWTVMKAEAAGMDNLAKNVAMSALTNGWGNMGSIVGKNSKLCEKQVEEVAKELQEMGI
jgi:hypothetical protein